MDTSQQKEDRSGARKNNMFYNQIKDIRWEDELEYRKGIRLKEVS